MRRWAVLTGLAVICFFAYCFSLSSPYELDYKHIAINTPVEYTKYLADKTYPSGEKYLAEDMAAVFNQFGYVAKVYALEDSYANRDFREGYEIYMRLFPEMAFDAYHEHLDRDRISVIFETLNYTIEQMKNADIVFTGSKKKNEEYRKAGINSFYLPQFTRLDKFYFSPREELKTKVLFVGNQWNSALGLRKSIQYGLESGVQIDVYGDGWKEVVPENNYVIIKDKQIKGDDLKYYYSSADIVLNDSHQFMIDNGFIANRVFDVTASKGFLISDYNKAIEEIYGDSVPMYKNAQEFKELIEYYLAHPEERREKAERAYKITKERFNAQKIMGEMIKIMEDYRLKNMKPKTFVDKLKSGFRNVIKKAQKNVTFRINLRKQDVDFNMYSAVDYLKQRFVEKGYEVNVLFGGNLYNPVADKADINVFIRGNSPFLDARINKKAKNLYFVLNPEQMFQVELNNFDKYLVNSHEFSMHLKALHYDNVKLVFGSASHDLLKPSDEYDVLLISDADDTSLAQNLDADYTLKAYTGKDFVKLGSKKAEEELAKARLVIYEPNPFTFHNNVPYAVLNIVSYGRPVLTYYAKIIEDYFGDDIETFKDIYEMREKIDKLLYEDALKREERAQKARQKLLEITKKNDIF